ncbi:MAG: TIGR02281 family clan AA aspartic protease [Micropepsaceae bacterium]
MRPIIWLALLIGLALGVWGLAGAFPGSLESDFDVARMIRLFAILALVSSGVLLSGTIDLGETVRNLAIWAAIVLVLFLGFSFQDELQFVWQRVRAELVPSYPIVTAENEMVLGESAGGQYHVIGMVNGLEVNFLVDTGASDTVLTPSDAERLGYNLEDLDFSRVYQTANGLGRGAPMQLDTLSVGPLVFYDFPASINETDMGSSLLGMSFLRQLDSFEVRDRRLYLRW